MEHIARLRALGLFDARVPRYTIYPTAPVFAPDAGTNLQAQALSALDPAHPVSVYVHIPFCERLCWFCACHTQGTKTLAPVEDYVATLEQEIALVAARPPAGLRMGLLHWGGGTPTILPPPLIHRLARALKAAIPPAPGWEISVEIDATMVDRPRSRPRSPKGSTARALASRTSPPRFSRPSAASSPST